MNLADILEIDTLNCDDGLCTSLWFNGCNFRCKGCHNYKLWEAVNNVDNDVVIKNLINFLQKPFLHHLSILGGEPLMEGNREDCCYIITAIRKIFPDIKIYLWTGYTLDELKEMDDININNILNKINILIDGRYIEELRDTSLKLRGSSNQKIHILR